MGIYLPSIPEKTEITAAMKKSTPWEAWIG
jgi:hypothetical protein